MASGKRYNVCSPRTYTQNGEEKTHFWSIGTAFPLKDKDGFSIRLYTRVLPSDELVMFVHEPREARSGGTASHDEPPPDDIPF